MVTTVRQKQLFPDSDYGTNRPHYETNNVKLFLGDCRSVMRELQKESIDMIFADPPYKLSNGGVTCHAGKRVSVNKGDWDKSRGFAEDTLFHEEWISECRRVLKPTGTIWITGTSHSIFQCGYLLQKLGFHMLNDIAWYKPNAAPNLACTTFAHSHETLLWARKEKKAKHIFNYELMKNGDFPDDRMKSPGKQMRSVWSISTPKPGEKVFGKHPTQKPLLLLDRIVRASTNAGSVILDPFNGSGTTGLAAEMIGNREYIGIDADKEALDLSIKRFQQVTKTI